eukprot:gene14433-biopygen23121
MSAVVDMFRQGGGQRMDPYCCSVFIWDPIAPPRPLNWRLGQLAASASKAPTHPPPPHPPRGCAQPRRTRGLRPCDPAPPPAPPRGVSAEGAGGAEE